MLGVRKIRFFQLGRSFKLGWKACAGFFLPMAEELEIDAQEQ